MGPPTLHSVDITVPCRYCLTLSGSVSASHTSSWVASMVTVFLASNPLDMLPPYSNPDLHRRDCPPPLSPTYANVLAQWRWSSSTLTHIPASPSTCSSSSRSASAHVRPAQARRPAAHR